MPKINVNSIKFKIYFLFILSNIIIFSVGIFIVLHYIALYSRKSLKEQLKSNLMSGTMAFLSERNYMLEKANDIIAHNFKSGFIRKTVDYKRISDIILVKIERGKIDYIKKFESKKYPEKVKISKKYYGRLERIISTKNRHIFAGFGRDKPDKLINITVIYRLLHKNNGYLIILNKHVTSDYLKNIRIKKHIPSNLGIYYGFKRSAISFVKNNKYEGLGQNLTKKQIPVLEKGISVYASLNVNGTHFYVYNVPIKNYDGKIIGVFGAGIKQYTWFRHLSKLYASIIFFIALYILTILIFILINKRFSEPFYDLLKSIRNIDPNNPQELNIADKYKNKESEFYEFAKAINVLNNAIVLKQKENSLIMSSINDFSKTVSEKDDFNSLTFKLIDMIVERMGYGYAWFGVLDEDKKEVKIISVYNNDFNYAKNLIFQYGENPDNHEYLQNLTAKAIKLQNYAVINDVENDTTIPARYKTKLLEFKFLSAGSFPLIMHGRVIGIMAIYSSKKGAFDDVKAGAIFDLANYAAYLITYLKNLKRQSLLSEMVERLLFSMTRRQEITDENKTNVNGNSFYSSKSGSRSKQELSREEFMQKFLNDIEDNMQTDFVEFIVFDVVKSEIIEGIFSNKWVLNLGKSTIEPLPTEFVRKRIIENRLEAYNYQKDDSATEYFKNKGVEDIILYSFEGTENRRYMAITGVIKRSASFYDEDLYFFKNGINFLAEYFGINTLFEKLDSSLELLENRENLINKMAEFGIVSINLTDKTVNLYNDYFALAFNIDKFSSPLELNEFYEKIKDAFEDKNFAKTIFETYINNKYTATLESIEMNLKNGIILSMKSNLFSTKDKSVIRFLVFGDVTNLKNNIKRLNLLNNLSYKLSMVFTLEYAIKTFAEGLCSIKKQGGGMVDSLHINIFDAVNKKTVTSLIYDRKKGSPPETDNSENADKIILKTANIDYEDYLSNCKLLKNEKNNDLDDTVNSCEFKGTAGSYMCFPLKISDELAGTISIDSEDKHFFTQEIIDLIKEIINIASPVFAKLILIETNRELALTDSLTGIHNRRFMYEFVKREIVRASRNSTSLSFAILDVDKFKNINDNYGHNIGDIMLVEFTNDLKSILLRKQDIITRYGGDEFVVVLPDTSKEKATNLMEKLRVYIENKIYTPKDNLNLNITISVGVSGIEQFFHDKSGEIKEINYDPDEILNGLLKIADDNLYRAKELGRNKVVG